MSFQSGLRISVNVILSSKIKASLENQLKMSPRALLKLEVISD
ncbi:hypothetical protein [Polaribacter sejongensis]|nr:hypothetical protein [Polaribacter sejongensis]